jgi:hypothetical protein
MEAGAKRGNLGENPMPLSQQIAAITAKQLLFTYSWSAVPPDNPRITGIPDSTFLNRHEGYEVLSFLNRHCKQTDQAHKAERLIRNKLPSDIRSHSNVLDWLQRNWNFYN